MGCLRDYEQGKLEGKGRDNRTLGHPIHAATGEILLLSILYIGIL